MTKSSENLPKLPKVVPNSPKVVQSRPTSFKSYPKSFRSRPKPSTKTVRHPQRQSLHRRHPIRAHNDASRSDHRQTHILLPHQKVESKHVLKAWHKVSSRNQLRSTQTKATWRARFTKPYRRSKPTAKNKSTIPTTPTEPKPNQWRLFTRGMYLHFVTKRDCHLANPQKVNSKSLPASR